MDEKKIYGEIAAAEFQTGDIVEWSRWESIAEEWEKHYGVIIEIRGKIVSNRLVSVATVIPIEGNREVELFSLSLKLISRAGEEPNEISS